ncbi:class IV adenylate cyclase [Candidatus Woesearchaeota archaeon]|nr:class IV adenylate cyclase [Candidatus Woesearchaeota archaeon]
MTKLEIEAKFKVEDLDSLRKKLLDLGLKSSGEEFYENIIFDYPDLRLKKDWIVFRLRKKGDKARITFKGKAENKGAASIREETEIKVSDFEKAKYIIRNLGFIESFVYEKKRENFKGKGFDVAIDKNPFIGIYCEIEADSEELFIDAMRKIGFDKEKIIKKNYRQVFEEYCKENNLDVKNMTFEEENG